MFSRIRAENQLFFLNTRRLEGIQSYSIDESLGDFTLKYIGFGSKALNETVNSAQYADLNLQSYLIQEDVLVQMTGSNCVNCFILNGQQDNNPYYLISGYLSSYGAKFSPNQIPQITTNFRFYNNAGNIYTGNLDTNTFLQISGIKSNIYSPFNNLIANSNYINLTLNESTGNRVLDFSYSLDINRLPIYNIGYPPFKRADIIFPINFSCEVTFEADPSFIDFKLTDFPINKTQQTLEIDVFSHLSNNPINKYIFQNATLVSNKKELNVDGNLTITRKYIGQIFSSIDLTNPLIMWDFGYVASGINFFLDWGFTSQSPSSGLDFGGI